MQANVDPSKPVEEWPLEQLAGKLAQYCPLMQDIQGSTLQQQAKGGSGFENLRAFLRNRGEQAYFQRVGFRADGSSCSVPRQAGLLWAGTAALHALSGVTWGHIERCVVFQHVLGVPCLLLSYLGCLGWICTSSCLLGVSYHFNQKAVR